MAHMFLRSSLKASLSRASISRSAFASPLANSALFHTSNLKLDKEDESKTEATATPAALPSALADSDLTLGNWKVLAPLTIAAGIPAISSGVYVVNEETQLACCFFVFCASVYKFGGDAIASFFDAKAEAILREHNAIEDASIAIAKETLTTHTQQTEIVNDMAAVQDAHKQVVELMCQVESHKLRHHVRDIFHKNLVSIVASEKEYLSKLQTNMVDYATNKVRSTVEEGGASVKEDAFSSALSVLSQSQAAGAADKEDDIAKLFCTHLKEYAVNLEEQTGQVVPLSSSEMDEIQAQLDVYMKRHDMEEAELQAPSEITLGLIK